MLLIYYFLRAEKQKQIILLVASLTFYAAGSIVFTFLLIAISLICWYLGIKISTSECRKRFLVTGIVICISVLCSFKYLYFFVHPFIKNSTLYQNNITKIGLPLGLSFYTLQAISYLCDVYYEKIKAENTAWKVMLYISFFPQIVSGPIVKARDFMPQLNNEHIITKDNISYGIQCITLGLFKKLVIADRIGVGVNAVYAAPTQYSGLSLMIAAVGYSIQI